MCMLLTKTESMSLISVLTHFYTRRFKRILPLYFLIILISVVALYTVFTSTAIVQNQSSALRALFFVSNRPKTGEEDYFEKLSLAMDIFTHTWSLSVEIQFYFVVPFIFLIGNLFSSVFKFGYYCLLGKILLDNPCGIRGRVRGAALSDKIVVHIFSGVISISYYFTSPQTTAFNSVFARIWQFLIGMIVYLIYFKKSTKPLDLPYNLLDAEKPNDDGKLKLLEEDGFDESEEEEETVETKVVADSSQKTKSYLGPFSKYFFLFPMVYIVTYPIAMYSFLLR